MKNITFTKQIICICVAVIIAMTAVIPAIAGTDLSVMGIETATDAPETDTDIPETNTEPPEEPSDPVTPGEPSEPEEKYVAKLSLYARSKAIPLFGHTWLYIENLTDHDLQVGAYTLPAGEGCSLGTFFYSRFDGPGLYYNLENHLAGKFGVRKAVSISENITAEQLETVSEMALNRNYWEPVTTCSGMPLTIWNAVTDRLVITIPHPLFVSLTLRLYDGHEIGAEMFPIERERVYKQRGFGDKATLDVCNDLSVANDF